MSIAGRKPDQEWYDEVIATVGLGDRLEHKPNELSGGQQQRVAVARALASRPRIVFADEPTGNLDSRSGAEVLELLRRSVDDHGQTVVMVTHDPVAAAYTDRVVFLADGRVVDELRDPDPRAGPRGHEPDGRAAGMTAMIRAALKSLLGRKVRLLMSTFAIVLGVAFVAGLADLLRHPEPQLHRALRLDRRRRRRPPGGRYDGRRRAVHRDAAREPGRAAARRPRRGPGRRQRQRVRRLRRRARTARSSAASALPAIGGNWSDAPAGHGLQGLAIIEGHEPHGPDEVVLDERTAERAGYVVGDRVDIIPSTAIAAVTERWRAGRTGPDPADLVGIAGFPSGGSLNGATYAAFDTPTAQDLFLGGEDAYTDIWVTADDGVSQERAARRRRAGALRRRRGGHRRRRRRRVGLATCWRPSRS